MSQRLRGGVVFASGEGQPRQPRSMQQHTCGSVLPTLEIESQRLGGEIGPRSPPSRTRIAAASWRAPVRCSVAKRLLARRRRDPAAVEQVAVARGDKPAPAATADLTRYGVSSHTADRAAADLETASPRSHRPIRSTRAASCLTRSRAAGRQRRKAAVGRSPARPANGPFIARLPREWPGGLCSRRLDRGSPATAARSEVVVVGSAPSIARAAALPSAVSR